MEDFDDDEADALLAELPIGDSLSECNAVVSSTSSNGEPTAEALHALQQFFGHAQFRPNQWRIVRTAMVDQRDQLVVMATGYGKSVCYQFPAVFKKKCTLVISPLISLMEDQVQKLNAMGIEAEFLGSSQSNKSAAYDKVNSGRCRLVYVTPEFATGDGGHSLIASLKNQLCLVAIDEAHCISQWGHDFRSSYRYLGDLRGRLSHVPFIALTATATPPVQKDIIDNLRLNNAHVTVTSFNRPNLMLRVRPKGPLRVDLDSLLVRDGDSPPTMGGPAIVYCPTRNDTESVHRELRSLGVSACLYHAGLSEVRRRSAHRDFVTDACSVIVATVAFGMGIDKPDIRIIVHYGAPKDVESYYQEIGRGGRDGLPCECVAFYANRDFAVAKSLITSGCRDNDRFRSHKLNMQQKMQDYLLTDKCRRRVLLQHFEDTNKLTQPTNCCDNCQHQPAGFHDDNVASSTATALTDYSDEATKLLSLILRFNERFGLSRYVAFLRGTTHKFDNAATINSPLYGSGKDRSKEWWSAFAQQLQIAGLLTERATEQNRFARLIKLTGRGRDWLQNPGRQPLKLRPSESMRRAEQPSRPAPVQRGTPKRGRCDDEHSTDHVDLGVPLLQSTNSKSVNRNSRMLCATQQRTWHDCAHYGIEVARPSEQNADKQEHCGALYHELMRARNDIARERDLAPYMVASNKALTLLAARRPSSRGHIECIPDLGVTDVQLDRCADVLLQTISSFCEQHKLQTDVAPMDNATNNECKVTLPANLMCLRDRLSTTVRESYDQVVLMQRTVDEVALSRKLAVTTIRTHLSDAIKVGLPCDLAVHFGIADVDSLRDTIETCIRRAPVHSDVTQLKPIMEALDESQRPEYFTLRAIVSMLEFEFGTRMGDAVAEAKLAEQAAAADDTSADDRHLPSWMAKNTKSSVSVTSAAQPPAKRARSALKGL